MSPPSAFKRAYAILDAGNGQQLFAKLFTSDATMEFEKASQVHRIAMTCLHFDAPRPLLVDGEINLIVWEGLSAMVPLRSFLIVHRAEHERTASIMRCCGRALGAIHNRLQLPQAEYWDAPSPPPAAHVSQNLRAHVSAVLQEAPCRHIHGDYACANLFVRKDSNGRHRLIVIDSSPNHYIFRGAATTVRAPIYYDVTTLMMTLYSKLSFYSYCRQQVRRYCEEFLNGYEDESGVLLDRTTVWACTSSFLSIYRGYQRNRSVESGITRLSAGLFRKYAARHLHKMAETEWQNGSRPRASHYVLRPNRMDTAVRST